MVLVTGQGEGLWLFNTLRTLPSELSRHHPLGIFFQVFSFKEVCRVSAAKPFLVSSPTTKDSRSFVSDARLHQLQLWHQLLIKLLAVKGQKC